MMNALIDKALNAMIPVEHFITDNLGDRLKFREEGIQKISEYIWIIPFYWVIFGFINMYKGLKSLGVILSIGLRYIGFFTGIGRIILLIAALAATSLVVFIALKSIPDVKEKTLKGWRFLLLLSLASFVARVIGTLSASGLIYAIILLVIEILVLSQIIVVFKYDIIDDVLVSKIEDFEIEEIIQKTEELPVDKVDEFEKDE